MSSGDSTQLGDLGVAVEGAAQALAGAFAADTTFAGLPPRGPGPDGGLFPKPLGLSGSDAVAVGPASLTLGESASYQVFSLSGEFVDGDRIVSAHPGAAWSKHELDVEVTATGGGGAGSVSLGLDTGVRARLLDYRRHAMDDRVAEAVVREIAQPRLPHRIAHLEAMAEGDAVAIVASGRLAFRAKFTHADLVPATVSILDAKLGLNGFAGASAFEVATGATVEVDFGASDEFRLVFTRGATLAFAVDVRKAGTTRLGADASFGITAQLANPGQLATLIESYLVGRLGVSSQGLQELLAKLSAATDTSRLSPEELQLLHEIVKRLSLGDAAAQFEALRARLLAMPDDLHQELASRLSARLELAFTAGYSRVEIDQTLASFEAARGAMERLHPALLRGDLSQVAAELNPSGPGGVIVNSYLATRQITTQLSFGVSLSVGSWAAVGTTTRTVVETTQRNLAQQLRWSFGGRVAYQSTWGRAGENYGFELVAAMPAFAATPAAANVDLGATLSWIWDKPLTPDLLARVLDLACLWRIVDAADVAKHAAALAGLAGQAVHAEAALTLGDAGVRRLAIIRPPTLQSAWIQAMAESLPRMYLPGSTVAIDIRRRRAIYRDVAAWVFGQKSGAELGQAPAYAMSAPRLSSAEESDLRQIDRPSGPSLDRNTAAYSLGALWSPERAGMWNLYQQTAAAFQELGRFTDGGASSDSIAKAFDQLAQVAEEDYAARLLGCVLAQVLGGRIGLLSGSLAVRSSASGAAVVFTGAG